MSNYPGQNYQGGQPGHPPQPAPNYPPQGQGYPQPPQNYAPSQPNYPQPQNYSQPQNYNQPQSYAQYGQPNPAATLMGNSKAPFLPLALQAGGGAVLLISAFLTWVSVSSSGDSTLGSIPASSASGMQGGDGIFAIILGAVLIGIAVAAYLGKLPFLPLAGLAAGAIATLFIVYELIHITSSTSSQELKQYGVSVSIGLGLYLGLLAAIVALVGGVLAFLGRARPS